MLKRHCAVCKKEIKQGDERYVFTTQKADSQSKRTTYGNFCSECYSKLELVWDD